MEYNGVTLQGSFRTVYRYLFDTDRPHSQPWEMLGFADKPVWWDAEYGAAPYTRGNSKLWQDIEQGVIRSGFRKGVDSRYVRPNLNQILPVDDGGNLLDPIAAKIVSYVPNQQQASAGWKIGDHGPVENLWVNSSSYAFALARASYLMRPAQFIEMGWDTLNLNYNNGSWLNSLTHNRPHSSQLIIHGEIVDGQSVARIGVQQWIVDRMRAQANDITVFANYVRSLDVSLIHKMAGFSKNSDLKVYADKGLVV
ncbi:MAG: hypothetical protein EOO38_32005, partial [Cytophagaceae bacterium]